MQTFDDFFRRATGHGPHAYQRALALAEQLPSVLAVPTGSGKTQALIGSWLYQRQVQRRGPRRLVYALPMRTLVEQTADVARRMRRRYDLREDELRIHVLMGGEPRPAEDWRRFPDADQIIVGTIDMLLSRALNRGYAESRYMWPVSFGLLNADCRWVFDEVQLMGSARATSAQLDGLRAKLGTTLPCETIWVSATVDRRSLVTIDRDELGVTLGLADEDRTGALRERLTAVKLLEREDLSSVRSSDQPKRIAALAADRHVAGTRTIVVVNRVDRAQAVFAGLRRALKGPDAPRTVLLHSRFRRGERAEHTQRALDDPAGAGTIVVATQVIEAGVDVSSRTLVTDAAPFSSIVQRAGRCNREGEPDPATIVWLDTGPASTDAAGRRAAAPYVPEDLEAAREALIELEGRSLSPETLDAFREVYETKDDPVVLRRRDLLDLFDTAPDLSGLDIDVAPFIRPDDDRNVAVFFRDLGAAPPASPEEDMPEPAELVHVPVGSVRGRVCWTVDHVDGIWTRRGDGVVAPGATVLLNARDGGYDDDLGWSPRTAKAPVTVVPPSGPRPKPEGMSSDDASVVREAQTLSDHLVATESEAGRIADALMLDRWRATLRTAAALHDVGKAHPVFQETLRDGIDRERHPDRDDLVWAKSERRGRHSRPFFRHELASALALLAHADALELSQAQLTAYLVAAHHGRVRLSIRPAPGEAAPKNGATDARYALGIVEGDTLPPVDSPVGSIPETRIDLTPMELGGDRSWAAMAAALRDDAELGPFRLGLLEALVRVADWRASA